MKDKKIPTTNNTFTWTNPHFIIITDGKDTVVWDKQMIKQSHLKIIYFSTAMYQTILHIRTHIIIGKIIIIL